MPEQSHKKSPPGSIATTAPVRRRHRGRGVVSSSHVDRAEREQIALTKRFTLRGGGHVTFSGPRSISFYAARQLASGRAVRESHFAAGCGLCSVRDSDCRTGDRREFHSVQRGERATGAAAAFQGSI